MVPTQFGETISLIVLSIQDVYWPFIDHVQKTRKFNIYNKVKVDFINKVDIFITYNIISVI